MRVCLSYIFIIITAAFFSGCKKENPDPNIAFKGLAKLILYQGAVPPVPFILVNGYSLNVKNTYLGLNNCENPTFPGPFITDSSIRCQLLTIFRDQDQKTILTPGNPIYINDTSTYAYWIDVSEKGKIKKIASFSKSGDFSKLRFCGLKDGYLWAISDQDVKIACYNLNLIKGTHVTDISAIKVCSLSLGFTAAGHAVEKGDVLYFADEAGKIYVTDISNRSNPKVISVINEQSCTGLELSGNMLMSKANTKLLFIDVSEPLKPQIKGRLNLKYSDAKLHNGYLYTGFQEMNIYDLSSLPKFKLLKKTSVAPYEISEYHFSGEYIYCRAVTAPYFTQASYPLMFKGNIF